MKSIKNPSGTNYSKNAKRNASAVRRAAVETLEGRTLLSGFGFAGHGPDLGQHGPVLTPFSGAESDTVSSLLAEPNGTLVAVGTSSGSLALARYNSAGAIDPSFGSGGKVTTAFPGDAAETASAALEPDGKVLVVTPFYNNSNGVVTNVLARYTTAGQLDPSFGTGGEVPVLAGTNGYDYVAVLPDGEIAVAGTTYDQSASSSAFAVEEYKSNGTLDTAFGTNGRANTPIGPSGSAAGIAVQGKDIIVAGSATNATTFAGEGVVARYTAAGVLDTSFGTAGLAAYPAYLNGSIYGVATGPDQSIFVVGYAFTFSPSASYTTFVTHLTSNGAFDVAYGSDGTATIAGLRGTAIAVQPDGKAVVAETTSAFATTTSVTQAGVARLTTSGALDGSFGTAGVVTSTLTTSDSADAIAIQPANAGTKIVIAGGGFVSATGHDFLLARYTTSGVVDPSFGSGGSVTTNFEGTVSAYSQSAISDGHGGTLVGGDTGSANGALTVADYLPNGHLNPNFGSDGTVQVTFNAFIATYGGYVALQKDGKILLVGTSTQPGTTNYDFAIARLLPDGRLDKSFGVDGKVTTYSGASFTDMGVSGGVVIQPDSKILVAGYTEYYGDGYPYTDSGVVVRYDSNGSLDTTFGTAGRETFPLTGLYPNRTTAIALEPNGEILVGGFITDPVTDYQDYVLEKLHANGTPDTSFGPGGQIVTGFSGFFYYGGPLLLRPDGDILVGGTTFDPGTGQQYMTVAQFTPAGAPDLSFGTGGQVSVGFPGDPNYTGVTLSDIAILPGGKVIVVGSYDAYDPTTFQQTTGDIALAEFTSGGNLDSSFGTGGSELSSFGGGLLSAAAVQVQDDGTFQVVGSSYDPSTQLDDFALADYYPDGTLISGMRQHWDY